MKILVIFVSAVLIFGHSLSQTQTEGCGVKCMKCDENLGCLICYGAGFSTVPSSTRKECKGPSLPGCIIHEGTVCKVCAAGKILDLVSLCVEPTNSVTTIVGTECIGANSNVAVPSNFTTSCMACIGKKPSEYPAHGPVCVAINTPITGCGAYIGENNCLYCNGDLVL
jgi:hypothetical protein